MVEKIKSIAPQHGGEFRVTYEGWDGDRTYWHTYAEDELEAYSKAKDMLKERDMNFRTFIVCVTLVLITAIGSCTWSNNATNTLLADQFNTCLAKNKTFSTNDGRAVCGDVIVRTVRGAKGDGR